MLIDLYYPNTECVFLTLEPCLLSDDSSGPEWFLLCGKDYSFDE